MRNVLSMLLLVLLVSMLLVSACGPGVTRDAGQAPVEVPAAVLAARDAALSFVGEGYGQTIPAMGVSWNEENTTPGWPEEPVLGWSAYRFTSGEWVVTVGHAVLPPELVVYQVTVANPASGFQWEGEINAEGEVTDREGSAGPPEGSSGPADARDAALAYLAEAYPGKAPAPGLEWTEEATTPEGLVGTSSHEYRGPAGGDLAEWVVTVSYAIVAPEATVYRVTVASGASGFRWQGDVDTAGAVVEVAGPGGGEVPPGASEDDRAVAVAGNSTFAFDLYQALRSEDGNLFFSPHSISLALAMTYAGARGGTEQEMAKVLRFSLPQARLHPAFRGLDQILASRGEGAQGRDGQGFRLNVANALWGQQGVPFLPEFLTLLDEYYGAGMRPLDFQNAPEEARLAINDWVSEETGGRIKDLIPPGALNSLTRLVLTNAIYFNAAWAAPFERSLTEDGAFHLLDGSQITVPMMQQTERLPYMQREGYQAVELPYDGLELAMLILLPEAGGFEGFEGALDGTQVDAILGALRPAHVTLTMPKFEFESAFSLRETLSAMGMTGAFSSEADFSGMTGDRDLSISEVLHKAFVAVDEEGTEAAAATAVIMKRVSAPAETVEMTIDQPFIFLIRDMETGAILFFGRVVDPRG